jgi:hypothetical protein
MTLRLASPSAFPFCPYLFRAHTEHDAIFFFPFKETRKLKMAGDAKTRQELMLLYRKVMEALLASRVDVIVFYGTLLGLVRGGDFIDGDDDIDVLISHTDLMRLTRAVDATEGLHGQMIGDPPRQIYKVFAGTLGPFDVYPYYLINDNRDVLVAWEAMIYDAHDIFPAQRVFFSGYSALTPRNTHKLLRDTYGSAYMIPQRKGAYTDSVSVRKCGDVAAAVASSSVSMSVYVPPPLSPVWLVALVLLALVSCSRTEWIVGGAFKRSGPLDTLPFRSRVRAALG